MNIVLSVFEKASMKQTWILSLVWFTPKTISNWAENVFFFTDWLFFLDNGPLMQQKINLKLVTSNANPQRWWNRCKWYVWRLSFFIAIRCVFFCLEIWQKASLNAFWAASLIWRDLWMPHQNVIRFDSTSHATKCTIVQHKWFVTDMQMYIDFHLHTLSAIPMIGILLYRTLAATSISYAQLLMKKWYATNRELYLNKWYQRKISQIYFVICFHHQLFFKEPDSFEFSFCKYEKLISMHVG